MTHRHDDAEPIEHDPTGMRALLGGLPDPGPMPEDLVTRITAALAAESRRGEGGAGSLAAPALGPAGPAAAPAVEPAAADAGAGAGSAPADRDVVVPLRRRRRGGRVLGAAAAAVVVLGIGGVVLDRLAPSGIEASLGLGGAADSASVASGAAPEAGPAAGAGAPSLPLAADRAAGVRVVELGPISSADLAAAASSLVAPPYRAFPGTSPAAGGTRAGTSVADPGGARACADALGVPPGADVLVGVGIVDGAPAAVVVAPDSSGALHAWVVDRACAPGDPRVRVGPVPLG